MAPIKLYALPASPPCRNLLMTLEMVGIKYELVHTDLFKGEHKTPEYAKMNPHCTIPTLVDSNGLTITESRAAMIHLAQKYDRTKKLLPEDGDVSARVHEKLYFDACTFYPACRDNYLPVMFLGDNTIGDDRVARLKEVLGWLDDMVRPSGFVAGTDHATLADLALLASYTTIRSTGKAFVDLEGDAYPGVKAWAKRLQALVPNYEKANGEGAKAFGGLFSSTFNQ